MFTPPRPYDFAAVARRHEWVASLKPGDRCLIHTDLLPIEATVIEVRASHLIVRTGTAGEQHAEWRTSGPMWS